jgi:hypothetical protein
MACSRWFISGVIAVLLLGGLTAARVDSSASNAIAQQHASHPNDNAVHADVSLGGDRVTIGPEFVPRRTDLPNRLIVSAGRVVDLPVDATFDYIEVGGTLRASRVHDTTLRFTHLVVLPGGYLDVGTQAEPIPCDRRVDFIVRDTPIDTARDPFQWGNGLVNFGRQTRVGCSKTAWVESAGGLPSGGDTITLASAPSNWRAGDELLIPDTATPAYSVPDPRRESKVTIASIDGTKLTLSKPLDFAHDEITDPNGVLVLRPRVANLTRNIVIRSENPDGTRGHTADVGRRASWDIRYNQLLGLGRTRRIPLDDTVLGSHLGLNQRGKYAEHHHHVQSAPTCSDVGNVYNGLGGGKWGLVTHDTSDTLIERNIAVDFPGAGFITEDGYEVRNIFRSNFAAYNLGRTTNPIGGGPLDASGEVQYNCPGCEGTGFWLRGIMNAFENNEAWNNFTAGINLFNQAQPPGEYPSTRGGEPDSVLKHNTDQPVSFTGNIVAANYYHGFEVWGVTRFPYENLTAAHNTIRQVMAIISQHVELHLVNPKLICSVGAGSVGAHGSNGYVTSFKIEQGEIAGCARGVSGGGSASGMTLSGTVMQNEINIDELWPGPVLLENVMHVPLAVYPHRYVLFGDGAVWDGKDPLPSAGISLWIPARGSRLVVKNWQGTNKDYRLFFRQSLASNPAWYSAPGPHLFNTPVRGLTMQESWDRYGLSFGGDVLKESEAVQLDGLVNGLAREGLGVHFGAPRAVVTFPTMRATATVEGPVVRIYALLTGDPDAASPIMMASVDGDPPQAVEKSGSYLDDRSFATYHIAPGVHTVKVWRTQKGDKNKPVPGSEYTSQYCIGPCPTIPHGRIELSAASVTFSADRPAAQTFTLSNSGAVALNWTAGTTPNWCRLNRYNGWLGVEQSATLAVSISDPPKAGSSVCTVNIFDNNASNSPQTITVNYSADR